MSSPSVDLLQLQNQLRDAASALRVAAAALKDSGASESTVQTIFAAADGITYTPPCREQVSWEARQALAWFEHLLLH
jgi:hypothetical protein